MKKLLAIAFAFQALAVFAEEKYIIEKVNHGTQYLKEGQQSAGFLEKQYDSVCGIAEQGGKYGAPGCAVVTPVAGDEGKTKYYLKETYVTGTGPLESNFVGYIEGSEVKGHGIGGDKKTGVYQVQ